jgi:hypothetical protein
MPSANYGLAMDERTTLLSAVGLALMFAACGGSVDNGPEDRNEDGIGNCADCEDGESKSSGGSSSNPGSGTGGTTAPAEPTEPAPAPTPAPTPDPAPAPGGGGIALRYGDFPPPSSSSGSTGSGGGIPIDPERIYVTLGSQKPLCEAPFESGGCGHWKVAFGLPPELLKPGVLELADSRLNSYSSFSGPDRGGGDCYGGGGSFVDGTVEIVSVDAEKIVIRLADTWTFDFDANGEHTIDRCN